MSQNAYLVLADGTRYEGVSIGAEGTVRAEVVFTTAMTGYIETLTDPSYFGQIVLHTFPMIGNYGTMAEDQEAAHPALRGYIVKNLCEHPSNFRSEGKLGDFLKAEGIVAMSGIDTRALTKKLREEGVMAAVLTTDPADAKMELVQNWQMEKAVPAVTCRQQSTSGNGRWRVVLWDFGAKANIERALLERGATVIRVPADTTAEEILALAPDGLMLSNGPGNPEECHHAIDVLKELAAHQIPTFGICLGNQLLALAHGFRTYKLKYGHRGANQPVRDLATGHIYITSQNHGYAVDSASIDPTIAKERFVSSNDGVCEGIDYLNEPTFSVQFHPEACAGPRDSQNLFDRFFDMMEVSYAAKS